MGGGFLDRIWVAAKRAFGSETFRSPGRTESRKKMLNESQDEQSLRNLSGGGLDKFGESARASRA